MIALYYFIILWANVLLSVFSKSQTLLIPAAFAAAISLLGFILEYRPDWSRFLNVSSIILGVGFSLYGLYVMLLSPLPILEHMVILIQGICGLLVTIAAPVIERLREECEQ